MIIQKIEIQNFRSYYRSNLFELTNGFNLIIGSNGDGKTTFYEALEWLFRTDNTKKMEEGYISKKRCEDLLPGEADNVSVSMTYEHDGTIKVLEKNFRFTKSFDNEIDLSNYSFTLSESDDSGRAPVSGQYFDHDLPSELRKLIMFKGEIELDVFARTNALKILIESFSDVKDFEAYFQFMEYAVKNADKAFMNAQKADNNNSKKIKRLNETIQNEKGLLNEIEKEINTRTDEATNFEDLLISLEKSQESSKLLQATNRRIESIQEKIATKKSQIKEDYTIDLLDQMWILLGYEGIAQEYMHKVAKADRQSREIERTYLMELGAQKMIDKAKKEGFTPLPVHIPGQTIMQEMLDEEVCKICGRKAAKGTEPWNYMLQRLEEYKASLKVDSEKDVEDVEPCFKNKYIDELQKRSTIINDHLNEITQIKQVIKDAIAFNARLREDLKKLDYNLEREFEYKKRILSQADGLSEEQLLARYEDVSNWTSQKKKAEDRLIVLKNQRIEHQKNLEEAINALNELSKGTKAEIYARIAQVVTNISKAFARAKESNKRKLLQTIEDQSNYFLNRLNIDDFKGSIRILERNNGQAEVALFNNDETHLYNPNTALKTTYLMSVLFAIGEIANKRKETDYPLLFDAPTSSFTEVKEGQFFDVISQLNKQVIIVTKSFLRESQNGVLTIDYSKIKKINGRVYRIEKKRPFDDKKLGTIQTVITKIK
ncbi:MAG: AAA family ATPase [Bacteroides sp.]